MFNDWMTGAVALGVLWIIEVIHPYFPLKVSHWRHALPNIGLAAANTVLNLLFVGLTIGACQWSSVHSMGVLYLFSVPYVIKIILAFLLFDLWMYGWHRLNHRFPFFWRFHKVHHSDHELDSTTALRFHPGEIFFSHVANLGIIVFLGMDLTMLVIYKMIFVPVIVFHHSNIALPEKWDRVLRCILVTPQMHRVHHSDLQSETDSNYSSVLSWWDRIFASFKRREDTRTIHFGLTDVSTQRSRELTSLLKMPIEKTKGAYE